MSDENDYILVYDYTTMVNIETGEYPLTFYEMRLRFNNTSFPVPCRDYLLEPYGYAPVVSVEMPRVNAVVTEGVPEKREDGRWYQNWEIRDYTEEEYKEELASRKLNSIENNRFTFENDLNKGIDFSYNGVDYKSKVRPFDISFLLSVKDIAQRNSEKIFTIPTADKILTDVSSSNVIEIVNSILDENYNLNQYYWEYIKTVMESTTLEAIPSNKETFLEYNKEN